MYYNSHFNARSYSVFLPYCRMNIVIKERNQTSRLLSFQFYKVRYVFISVIAQNMWFIIGDFVLGDA